MKQISETLKKINLNDPGFIVGEFNNNECVDVHCQGYSNMDTEKKIGKESIFPIASITKTFTAAGIMRLFFQEKLQLTDSIVNYVDLNPSVYKSVKIIDLLNHYSGIRAFYSPLVIEEKKEAITNNDVFAFLNSVEGKSFSPGDKIDYINSGYVILSEIIKNISSKTYEGFITEEFLHPLKLKHTSITDSKYDEYLATGYENINGSFKNYHIPLITTGDCGIKSTITDLAKWSDAFFNESLFSDVEKKEIFKAYYLNDESLCPFRSAWIIEKEENTKKTIRTIEGGLPGFHSMIISLMEEPKTFVVLSNTGFYKDEWEELTNKIINSLTENQN